MTTETRHLPADRVPVPVLSPSLTGGATAEVEALMPAA